jgi:large conductance mechanosensitive channel
MLKEFKAFLLRGNVVDLAVGIVIGAAFVAVVTAFVENILTPVIGMLFSSDFGRLKFTINDSAVKYGLFLNALIAFVLVAAAVFFFVVKPINAMMARFKTQPDVESPTKECPECLSNIPAAAKRCAYCTASLSQVP